MAMANVKSQDRAVSPVSLVHVRKNIPALDACLANDFKEKFREITTNAIAICVQAWEVKLHHTDDKGAYTKEFKSWYESHELVSIFGAKPNFTKYARAGQAIEKVRASWTSKFDQLPTSMNALYEISQLTTEELRLCFQDTYRRKSISAPESEWTRPEKPTPLIHPQTTAARIRSWRESWRNPSVKPVVDCRVPLLNVFVHNSLYQFDEQGHKPSDAIDLASVQVAYEKFISTLKALNADAFIRVEDNFDRLKQSYESRQAKAVESGSKKKKARR